MKIDKWLLGFMFFVVCVGCSLGIALLSSCSEDPDIDNLVVVDSPWYFLHIDDGSGFLSHPDVMASYQVFKDRDGNITSIWMRVERYGFNQVHEFSVDTVIEADSILEGLANS